jgi:hypothetical protein
VWGKFFGICHPIVLWNVPRILENATLKTIYSNEHKFFLSVTQEPITLPQHMSSSWILVGFVLFEYLVFCVMFCGSLFVLLSFFFWLLHCLSFFDLWLLMTLCHLQTFRQVRVKQQAIFIYPFEASFRSFHKKQYSPLYVLDQKSDCNFDIESWLKQWSTCIMTHQLGHIIGTLNPLVFVP